MVNQKSGTPFAFSSTTEPTASQIYQTDKTLLIRLHRHTQNSQLKCVIHKMHTLSAKQV